MARDNFSQNERVTILHLIVIPPVMLVPRYMTVIILQSDYPFFTCASTFSYIHSFSYFTSLSHTVTYITPRILFLTFRLLYSSPFQYSLSSNFYSSLFSSSAFPCYLLLNSILVTHKLLRLTQFHYQVIPKRILFITLSSSRSLI